MDAAMAIPMTEDHQLILQKNVVKIVNNLVLTPEFMAVLVQNRVLTRYTLETILYGKKTRSDSVRELVIHTLPCRSDAAFSFFIEALVESRQDHIALLLDANLADRFIKIRDDKYEVINQKRPTKSHSSSFDYVCRPVFQLNLEDDEAWYDRLFQNQTKELGIEMKPMSNGRREAVLDMMNKKKAYHIEKVNGKFGRAVIINNEDYKYQNTRPGSSVDAKNLEQLFQQLHFETEIHSNLTAEKMQDVLTKESNMACHSKYSMFVLCILAHGGDNKVYGVDTKLVREGNESRHLGGVDISDITSKFSGFNCKSLAGKPKLFFIQACQGDQHMLTLTMQEKVVPLVQADDVTQPAMQADDVTQPAMQVDDVIQADGNREAPRQQLNTPDVADVLVARSTAPGYKSWRHPEYGSWFIRCLIYVLLNNACEEHVLDSLTQVAFIISHFKIDTGFRYKVQVPEIRSTLRKKVFFMP